MREVSITTANQGISKLIREIERGQRVLITRRGKPVAMLQPMPLGEKKPEPRRQATLRARKAA